MKRVTAVFALIFILLLGPAIWLNTLKGVYLYDHFLWRRGSGEYAALNGWRIDYDETSGRFEAILGSESVSAEVALDGGNARFTYDDGTVVEGFWDSSIGLIDPDGTLLSFSDDFRIVVDGEIISGSSSISKAALSSALCRIAMGDLEAYGSIGLVLVGILIYGLGAVQFLYPEEMHFLFSRWRYRNAELSDDGVLAERIGAAIVMIVAAGIMFAPLFA